jgi:TRAP-type uncharacterized transport system fused permease subunit
VPLGLIAGFGVAAIFHLRNKIEQRLGKAAVRQPRLLGFELEDVLYLLPLVTLLNGLLPFLITAAIGAPLGAVLVTRQFLRMRDPLSST